MNDKRTFLASAESVQKFSDSSKLAVSIGGVIYEARAGETLHQHIALRVVQSNCIGPYREGWTYPKAEVTT